MKAIAYNIKPAEKERLAIANQKKHAITLISNALEINTVNYVAGKDAVIVSGADQVSADILEKLAAMRVKYLISRSVNLENIDLVAANNVGITVANAVPETASQLITHLDLFQLATSHQDILTQH